MTTEAEDSTTEEHMHSIHLNIHPPIWTLDILTAHTAGIFIFFMKNGEKIGLAFLTAGAYNYTYLQGKRRS